MNEHMEERNEKGFTLIELLIAIVVVGILAAVAIVGIGGLTQTANTASCKSSMDSAITASAAYYANQTPNAYQPDLAALYNATPKVWETPNNTAPVGQVLSVGTWKLTETNPNGTVAQPTFACS